MVAGASRGEGPPADLGIDVFYRHTGQLRASHDIAGGRPTALSPRANPPTGVMTGANRGEGRGGATLISMLTYASTRPKTWGFWRRWLTMLLDSPSTLTSVDAFSSPLPSCSCDPPGLGLRV